VNGEVLEHALSTAMCLVLPSRREGYGRVVIEASARGVPVVVVAGPDNAATELVEEGVNGMIAATAQPKDLAEAISGIRAAGPTMRQSTTSWFRRHAERLSVGRSIPVLLRAYGDAARARS
jgi:glycosyltransferase involved in cell wall biosynthesis